MANNRIHTVEEVIRLLVMDTRPEDKIAVNWWSEADFAEYNNIDKALRLAQDYLDNLNPDLTQYVEAEYEDN
jgi:hypothetical protein